MPRGGLRAASQRPIEPGLFTAVCHCLPQGKQCRHIAHGTASDEAVAHCGGSPRASQRQKQDRQPVQTVRQPADDHPGDTVLLRAFLEKIPRADEQRQRWCEDHEDSSKEPNERPSSRLDQKHQRAGQPRQEGEPKADFSQRHTSTPVDQFSGAACRLMHLRRSSVKPRPVVAARGYARRVSFRPATTGRGFAGRRRSVFTNAHNTRFPPLIQPSLRALAGPQRKG